MSITKRLFDIFASAAGLALLLLPMAAIALLIRLTSPGPSLFRQKRVGQAGKDFTLLKFRTMTIQAGSEKGSFDVGNSSRVTCLGRFLRTTKLDEFPQLLNVLTGSMSLVGPRPEVRKWVDAYPDRWARVHKVRPGITDSASILFRNEEELLAEPKDPEKTYRDNILPAKLDIYEQYVQTRTFFGDLKILFQTFLAVLFK